MKKWIAILVAVMMMASALTFAVSADDAVCVTSSLDSVEAMVGSLIANDTGTVNISGKSLKINTQNAAYGLNGNPETPDKYDANYNGSRRLKLVSFDDGMTLPAGTYTVSIYVYENGNHLGDQISHKSELALSLHTADETDESLAYNHANVENLIKLFPADENDTANCFEKSGVEQKVGNRKWGQYTATVTLAEAVSQFTFWIILDGDVGEKATISTWIDNLAIYNEAGDPTPKEEESSNNTESDDAPDTDDGTTTAPVTTEAPKNTTEAPTTDATDDEKGGCGAVTGIGAVCLVAIFGAAMLSKKKDD